MIQILIRIPKVLVRLLKEKKTLFYAGIYIICLWLVATLLFHLAEGISIYDSFYWAVTTTTTVGYGDITPQTLSGKIIAIVVMVSGIGILGLFLASVADILIEQSLRRRHPRTAMEGHILALGWDKKLEMAVKELISEGKEVAVVAEVDTIPLEDRNLIFIRGDPTDEEDLRRANSEKASFAIISGRTDTETLLAAIAVRKINPDIGISCIVADQKVTRALESIGVDQVLSVDEFFGLVLSRSVFAPKISVFLHELMATKGMDVYQQKIPEFEGRIFGELLEELKEKHNAILLGIVRGGQVILNPEKGTRIEREDEVIYIAEKAIGS